MSASYSSLSIIPENPRGPQAVSCDRHYSGFTLDCLMMARYFSLSAFTKAVNASMVIGLTHVSAIIAQLRQDIGLHDDLVDLGIEPRDDGPALRPGKT
jgi:hypothetical protein